MKQKLTDLYAKNGTKKVLASLLSILAGLLLGSIVVIIVGLAEQKITTAGMWEGVRLIFAGILSTGRDAAGALTWGFNAQNVGNMLFRAMPLIMTGLSVAVAFKTGLFNIGAAGQYTVGAYFALYSAIVMKLPWWACLLAAALGGAIWGSIPGLFKAFLNVNEVITSIMFNWIGLYAVNTLIYQGGTGVMFNTNTTKTYTIKQASPGSLLPTFNVGIGGKDYFGAMFLPTIGIFIAVAVAVVVWVVLNKTTFGYELKACGHNKDAAKYAGINDKKNIVLSMTIAGALAGLGAGLFYLSGSKEWEPLVSTALPAVGFNGISVALLASSNPVGCIFSALFIAHITVGGGFMDASVFPGEVSDIISGVVIYLCAFSLLFKSGILKFFTRKPKTVSPENGKEREA